MAHALILLIGIFQTDISALTIDCYAADQDCNGEPFIFPETESNVTVNCQKSEDCNNLVIYSATSTLTLNCLGAHSCNGIKVYCGDFDPPGSLYSVSDMDQSGIYCQVHCTDGYSAPACVNSLLSCKGDGVVSCYMESYEDPADDTIINIDTSTVECNIQSSNQCYMQCTESLCIGELLCHSASVIGGCDCVGDCMSVTETYDVTYAPTTDARTTNIQTVAAIATTNHPTNTEPTITSTQTITATTTAMLSTVLKTSHFNVNPSLVTTYNPTTHPSDFNEYKVIDQTNLVTTDISNGNGDPSVVTFRGKWYLWIGISVVIVIIVIVLVFRIKKRKTVQVKGNKLSESVDITIEDAPDVTTPGDSTQNGSVLLMTEIRASKIQKDHESDSGENDDLYVNSQQNGGTVGGSTTTGYEAQDEDEMDNVTQITTKGDHDEREKEGIGDQDSDNENDTEALYVKPDKGTSKTKANVSTTYM